ncbi:MAG TPA: hypothetical protein P5262_04690 [Candidatus Moranbacteria bacterium]|nr:hypothetical protein [Candidatus Moranbacteria bacterium]
MKTKQDGNEKAAKCEECGKTCWHMKCGDHWECEKCGSTNEVEE